MIMQSILVKLGKIFSTFKQEGFWGGIKKSGHYFELSFDLIFRITPGDVLIISGGIGDSAYYRAFNQAEELKQHGIKTAVTLQENPRLLRLVDDFRIFIFRRTLETALTQKVIQEIKTQKKVIIFETDDLVFDLKCIQNTELYKTKMTELEKRQYQKGLGLEILADAYVKNCVTSTSYLAKILESYGKKVFVSKNKISQKEVSLAQKLVAKKQKNKSTEIRIGYFSGTSSHDRDFEQITKPLLNILKKYSSVKLVLGGPLKINVDFEKYATKIERLPLVSREKYYANLCNVDINLAPLVLGDLFCEAKSEIKFLEAGILQVPTVATKNQTFSECIVDGVDGFLAENEKEWQAKLEQLIKDDKLRLRMGKGAQNKIIKDFTIENSHNENYYAFLRKLLSKKNNA
jgi:glycosyltransferase involved in cell wall biosynthesis